MASTQASKRLMSKMVQAMPICIIMRELGRVSGGFLNRNRIQVCFLRDWLIHKQVFATVVFKKGSWILHYCIQTTMLSFCPRFLTLTGNDTVKGRNSHAPSYQWQNSGNETHGMIYYLLLH